MKFLKFSIIILLFIVIFSTQSYALSIGTSPGAVDLGTVQRGKSYPIKFYLLTDSEKDIIVHLSYIPVHLDFYTRNHTLMYRFYPSNSSQEDISSWIKFTRNPVVVSRSASTNINFPGSVVKGSKEVIVMLNIPEDAEPGYHAGSISISPSLSTKMGVTGAATIGITRFVFVFNVEGPAKREGRVIDVEAQKVANNKIKINTLFQNTGTDTVLAAASTKIYDEFGRLITTLGSGYVYVKPGMIGIIPQYWIDPNIKAGDYRVETTVNYLTGYASKETTIKIPEVVIPTPRIEKPFPWWLLLLILILIGIIIIWKW